MSPYLGPEDIATPVFPSIEGHRPQNHFVGEVRVRNHGSAREAREIIRERGEKPENFHFWSVEREPLDKCLSHYSMMRYSPDHGRLRLSNPRSLLLQPPVFNWNTYCLRGSFPLDDDRLLDEDGGLQVDTLLRYERLSTDLGDFVRSLGVNGFSLDATVKSGFRGGKRQRIRGWQVRRIYQAFDRSLPHTGYDSESVARTLEKLGQRPLS